MLFVRALEILLFTLIHKQTLFPENLNVLNLGFGQNLMSRRLHR